MLKRVYLEKIKESELMHATVGKGDHLHCALNLFYQMDNLVPGAFRLFVNLVSPRQG